jgi:hypothetical protein
MPRSSAESPEEQHDLPILRTLDGRLADLLAAIEQEEVPDRLLGLARQLQAELVRRKQRRNSN